jgi:hypothetical protein
MWGHHTRVLRRDQPEWARVSGASKSTLFKSRPSRDRVIEENRFKDDD